MKKLRNGDMQLSRDEYEYVVGLQTEVINLREKVKQMEQKIENLQYKNQQLESERENVAQIHEKLLNKEKYLEKKINQYRRKENELDRTLAVAESAINIQRRKSIDKKIAGEIESVEVVSDRNYDDVYDVATYNMEILTPIDVSVLPLDVRRIYMTVVDRWEFSERNQKDIRYANYYNTSVFLDSKMKKWRIRFEKLTVENKKYSNLIENLIKVDIKK